MTVAVDHLNRDVSTYVLSLEIISLVVSVRPGGSSPWVLEKHLSVPDISYVRKVIGKFAPFRASTYLPLRGDAAASGECLLEVSIITIFTAAWSVSSGSIAPQHRSVPFFMPGPALQPQRTATSRHLWRPGAARGGHHSRRTLRCADTNARFCRRAFMCTSRVRICILAIAHARATVVRTSALEARPGAHSSSSSAGDCARDCAKDAAPP